MKCKSHGGNSGRDGGQETQQTQTRGQDPSSFTKWPPRRLTVYRLRALPKHLELVTMKRHHGFRAYRRALRYVDSVFKRGASAEGIERMQSETIAVTVTVRTGSGFGSGSGSGGEKRERGTGCGGV